MPLVQRYEDVIQGAMVLTGNTLVTRLDQPYPPAPQAVTGVYISTNTGLQEPGYPPGTTQNYLNNSSMAILNVLPNSTIAFAQLMWVADTAPAGTENDPVNFTTPVGTTAVTPTLFDANNNRRWRAADVTALVQAGIDTQPINGEYTVGGVPGRSPIPVGTTTTAVSWGLIVVYENTILPFRYFNINTGFDLVSSAQQLTFNFTNIVTPTLGAVSGFLLTNYTAGDIIDEAQVRVGENAGSAVQIGNASNPWNGLSPYSRINNMFPGNILNADAQDPNIGLLDTRGTFGNLNLDPYADTAPPAARNLYDIAGYDISNTLVNNQTNLYTNITFIGTGSALVQSQSIQIDLNAPRITPLKAVNPTTATVGDTLTYTINFTNNGSTDANNVVITDTIQNETTYIPASFTITGNTATVSGPNPLVITLDNPVAIGETVNIQFDVTVDSFPISTTVDNFAQIAYDFIPGGGLPPQPATVDTNTTSALIILIDFGDCPDTSLGTGPGNYRTLLSNDGPRHIIGVPLLVGIDITAEPDGLQNPTATGDVDDGLTLPLPDLRLTDSTYSLDVPFTNNTGTTANIYAWLDFNNNGVFEGNEAVVETINSDTTNPRILTLTFTKPPSATLIPGLYFLRIRITTDNLINVNAGDLTLEDTRSFGLANDGEVEDYSFNVIPLSVTICEKQHSYKC